MSRSCRTSTTCRRSNAFPWFFSSWMSLSQHSKKTWIKLVHIWLVLLLGCFWGFCWCFWWCFWWCVAIKIRFPLFTINVFDWGLRGCYRPRRRYLRFRLLAIMFQGNFWYLRLCFLFFAFLAGFHKTSNKIPADSFNGDDVGVVVVVAQSRWYVVLFYLVARAVMLNMQIKNWSYIW